MSSKVAVSVRDLWKRYRLWHERRMSLKEVLLKRGRGRFQDFWALKGISFEVPRGETFGVIGANGSGKSTLLKLLGGILLPNSGEVEVNGRLSTLLELGAGFHPELTGRENVFLNGSILGLSRKQIENRMDSIVEFSGLDGFIDSPIRSYSSGMTVRLGFSVAVHVDPEILLVDEVLAVGDEEFQRKSAERILSLRDQGATIIVVSHSLNAVRGLCTRAIWLSQGEIAAEGFADKVVQKYLEDVGGQVTGGIDWEKEAGQTARFGSGLVKVEDVAVFGDSAGSAPVTGEPATIRLGYVCSKPVERPVFGIAVHSADGVHVTGPNTRDAGVEIESIQGAGSVEFRIDQLALLPGEYVLSIAVPDHTQTEPFDHHDRLHRFKVESGAVKESRGVVTLGGRWRIGNEGG